MSGSRIVYRPTKGAIAQGELDALAACYRFILDCHTKKKGTRPGDPDDPERTLHARAKNIIPNDA